MNQPPLTIFSDNGVLKGAVMPEEPHVLDDAIDWKKFETAK